MTEVGVYEAKTHLSRLLRLVEDGEEVVIQRAGKAVARIVPARPARRVFGQDAGLLAVPEDFNDPLDEMWDEFYDEPLDAGGAHPGSAP